MLYLLGALRSLIKRDLAKFGKKSLNIFATVFLSNVNALLLSTALKFEISIFCGMPRDFKVSQSSFGFPIFSASLSSKNARFCAAINFNVLYFIVLYFFAEAAQVNAKALNMKSYQPQQKHYQGSAEAKCIFI